MEISEAEKLWVVYDEAKAREAGATQNERVLYVITVADLASVFNDVEGLAWDDLTEENRAKLIAKAIDHLDALQMDWTDAFQQVIAEGG